jgi:hypothetical protein
MMAKSILAERSLLLRLTPHLKAEKNIKTSVAEP